MSEINRRAFVAAAAAATFATPRLAQAQTPPAAAPSAATGPFKQPPLGYAEDALAPTIGARTVALHYGRHHAGY